MVTLGVLAHGEMRRFAVLPLGFTIKATASGDHFGSSRNDIGHLQGDPRPGALALATAVNRDEATGDGDFGDVRVLPNDVATETTRVKRDRPLRFGGPNRVL